MSDLLLKELPTRWAGREIDPDFRPMVWLVSSYARGLPDKDPLGFAAQAIRRFYKRPDDLLKTPERAMDAYRHLLEFCVNGETATTPCGAPAEQNRSTVPGFDYLCDAPYIVAAFQRFYGIDLTTESVHWFRFRALLQGVLGEDCLFSRIVDWRTADLTEMDPETRKRYEQKRELFRLPPEVKGGAAPIVSVEEHENAFIERFRTR